MKQAFCILSILLSVFDSVILQGGSFSDSPFVSMFNVDRNRLQIPDIDDAYGVAFRDLNGDSRPDLYLVCFRSLNRLLLNRGPGSPFEDATVRSGLGGNLMPMGIMNLELSAAILDFDNDGDGDVVIAGWGEATRFYQNEGRLDFLDIREKISLSGNLDANACVTADVDNDGFLDLFLTDEHYSNRLLINDRKGGFTDRTRESGLAYQGVSQGAAFCDVDSDEDQDLFVTNWFAPDLFYSNSGDGRFHLIKLDMEVCQRSLTTNSVTFGDIDNDGDFDLFIANREGRNFLYLNETVPGDTSWFFTEAARSMNLLDESVSYGGVFGDFNQDGWLDLFVTNVGSNQFYLNTGRGSFEKVFEEPSLFFSRDKGYSTGAAACDYDSDGDLDLAVANKDTFSLFYVNPVNDSSFIKVYIRGVRSNRDGIGARVELYRHPHGGDSRFLLGSRMISDGSGYLSMNEPVAHFGIQSGMTADISTVFPSGRNVLMRDIRPGRTLTVYEYPGWIRLFKQSSALLVRLVRRRSFWYQLVLVLLFGLLTAVFIRLGLKRYQWRPGAASVTLAGFVLMAFVLMVILKSLGWTMVLWGIDMLTVVFIAVSVIYSERLFRVRRMREKYRSLLIRMSREVVEHHDEKMLLNTVADTISQNPEISKLTIMLAGESPFHFSRIVSRGTEISISDLEKRIEMKSLVGRIKKERILNRHQIESFKINNKIPSDLIIAIQREDHFYGCLALKLSENLKAVSGEDAALFQSIANQMAVALENIAYIKQSTDMARKLAEAEIRERYLSELEYKNKELDRTNNELEKLYNELKQAETQLIQSEKMASLGQLVAGISHELNNPIAFIYSNVRQLKTYVERLQQNINGMERSRRAAPRIKEMESFLPDIQKLIEDTSKGSRMIKDLVESLRRFSHLDQALWKRSDIHEGLETSLKILNSEMKGKITLHKTFESAGFIDCNIGQLNQVFVNLLINAVQAIPKKGNIWIATRDENDQLIIEIRDDGQGIQEDIQSKIFDPFFTTKEVGKGIGLGLSISYSIIEKHGGTIEVESGEGKGSLFRIRLPYGGKRME